MACVLPKIAHDVSCHCGGWAFQVTRAQGSTLGLIRWDAAIMEVSSLTRTSRYSQVMKGVQSPQGLIM